MPKVKLTTQFVLNPPLPTARKIDYYDSSITGFILEVRSSGLATFYLRYRDLYGHQRQVKIGDAKSISLEQAKQKAKVLRSEVVLRGEPNQPSKVKKKVPTLRDFVNEHYLGHIATYRRNYAPDLCRIRIHLMPRFGHLHLDQISSAAVMELHQELRSKGYAAATSNMVVILLSVIFNYAKKLEIPGSEVNPTSKVTLFKVNNIKDRYLKPEESQRLKDAIDQSENVQLKYIVALLLLTGARKREILDATWANVDLERRVLTVPKSKSGHQRKILLSETVVGLLNQVPRFDACPYVVPNLKTMIPFASIYASWNTARKRAGLKDVRLHDLRHSFASNLVNSGHSLYVVSKALGHSQIRTTTRYAHLSSETLLAAVENVADATGVNWSVK
jgi:integrase